MRKVSMVSSYEEIPFDFAQGRLGRFMTCKKPSD